MAQTVCAYCPEWHVNVSSAFSDILVNPLREHIDLKLTAWDGKKFDPSDHAPGAKPFIFCMFPPPPDLSSKKDVKIVWVPMWDQAYNYNQSWWDTLSINVRIIAFSDAVAQKAERAGLHVFRACYYCDPSQYHAAQWSDKRVLAYWNRRGITNPRFLEKFCSVLNIDRLIFRAQTDPSLNSSVSYPLPSRLGKTIVKELPANLSRDEYLAGMREANILLAPRLREGVGLTFLEAMARGCAVFAFDKPTMNEYIKHCESGYLFPAPHEKDLSFRIKRIFGSYASHLFSGPGKYHYFPLSIKQDWDKIACLDLKGIGNTALKAHYTGFKQWQGTISGLADFMLRSEII
ncbi:glycosyltransferase [Verrucomicrobiota bacterium]